MNRLAGPTKPILRWAGSKRKLLGKLKGFWRPDRHRRYVEPFAGSACLFFELEPKRAILGDTNAELIQLYKVVKKDAHALYARLCQIPRDSATFYRWRSKNLDALDEQTRALRFLYLNRNCFNGIFRTNLSGQFNVPFGAKHGKPIGKLERADYIRAAEQLSAARLIAGDFSKTLALVKAGDFVYLDPPFAVSSKRRRLFTEYGKNVFGPKDVERLETALSNLDEEGVDFLVSYADCAEARFLARNWNAKRLSVRRHIAGFSAHRRNASEWLITNCDFPETHDHVEVIDG